MARGTEDRWKLPGSQVNHAAMTDQIDHAYFPETGIFPFQKVYVYNNVPLWTTAWWDKLKEDSKRRDHS